MAAEPGQTPEPGPKRHPSSIDHVPGNSMTLCRFLFASLISLVEGVPLELISSIGGHNGFEVWRRLCADQRRHSEKNQSMENTDQVDQLGCGSAPPRCGSAPLRFLGPECGSAPPRCGSAPPHLDEQGEKMLKEKRGHHQPREPADSRRDCGGDACAVDTVEKEINIDAEEEEPLSQRGSTSREPVEVDDAVFTSGYGDVDESVNAMATLRPPPRCETTQRADREGPCATRLRRGTTPGGTPQGYARGSLAMMCVTAAREDLLVNHDVSCPAMVGSSTSSAWLSEVVAVRGVFDFVAGLINPDVERLAAGVVGGGAASRRGPCWHSACAETDGGPAGRSVCIPLRSCLRVCVSAERLCDIEQSTSLDFEDAASEVVQRVHELRLELALLAKRVLAMSLPHRTQTRLE